MYKYTYIMYLYNSNYTSPPLKSALAPIYWKLSMLMTSMMGHTTLFLSSTTRASSGSNQFCKNIIILPPKSFPPSSSVLWTSNTLLTLLHSQCESKNVRMPEVAASAPFTLDLINPSLCEFRNTRTLCILDNSSPSEAGT